jgi:hypothetical protein
LRKTYIGTRPVSVFMRSVAELRATESMLPPAILGRKSSSDKEPPAKAVVACAQTVLTTYVKISRLLDMPRASDFGRSSRTVKTSVELPEDLWRAAKIRAMDEKRNLQDVIAAATCRFPEKGAERRRLR